MKKVTAAKTNKISASDVPGKALLDFYSGKENIKLDVYSDISEDDEIPMSYFFRKWKDMPEIEKKALEVCKGKILDVGAAAGCHALYLQRKSFNITAIDISDGAVEVMKKQGLRNVKNQNFFTIQNEKYDTILMLMNGIGICGTLEKLDEFFAKAKELLASNGQVLVDSSDILYMFEEEDGSVMVDLNSNYYGEVKYQFGYAGQKTGVFDWLFIDFDLLKAFALKHGFNCEMILEGPHYDYLAKLSINPEAE